MQTHKPKYFNVLFMLIAVGMLLTFSGCSSIYYSAMESLGKPKREILVDRVQAARNDQEQAKEQFQTALEKFSAVVQFEGGDLEKNYNKLNTEFERCEERADDVHERIESIRNVSKALFSEWESELNQYSNESLRRSSERQLEETRARYTELITAMERAEQKMDPVLAAFRDQVLYLKHNLNARAVAALEGEVSTLESDVARLIAEMNESISAADEFISSLEGQE